MRTTELNQRYRGTYVATVLGVDDPTGLGRVRIRTEQVDDTSDDPLWAIIARPLGGEGSSVFFTPREQDQVVISYLNGDPRQPIVLGYAHFDDRKPSGVNARKHAIVTKAGTVTFDEDAGEMTLSFGGSSIKLTPTGISINAPSVCINGHGVVLAPFLQLFDLHAHQPLGPPPVDPPVTIPNTVTSC
jgi:hypothetical protein